MNINSCTHENWTLKQNYESLTKGYEGKKLLLQCSNVAYDGIKK